jgi:hypothetical protein
LASTPVNISALDDIHGKNLNVTLRIFTCKVINIGASKIRKYMNLSFMAHQSSVEGHHKKKKRMEVGFFSFRSESRCSEIPGKKSVHRVGGEINKEKVKTQTHLGNQRRFGLDTGNYTGITSSFDVSSHLKTIPSRLAGKMHLGHCHPVANGSGGATIISTLSFL